MQIIIRNIIHKNIQTNTVDANGNKTSKNEVSLLLIAEDGISVDIYKDVLIYTNSKKLSPEVHQRVQDAFLHKTVDIINQGNGKYAIDQSELNKI